MLCVALAPGARLTLKEAGDCVQPVGRLLVTEKVEEPQEAPSLFLIESMYVADVPAGPDWVAGETLIEGMAWQGMEMDTVAEDEFPETPAIVIPPRGSVKLFPQPNAGSLHEEVPGVMSRR